MIWWDKEFVDLCQKTGINLLMYLRYVDDTNKALIAPPLGSRFVDGKLVVSNESIEEDRKQDRDKVVGCLLKTMANSIVEMFKFEEDVPSNHPDKRLPILDLKLG